MVPAGDRSERKIALAAVAGAHGVKGEVRLKLFSEDAKSLAGHSRLYVGGTLRQLLSVKESGKMPVARFDGIANRTAAESLRGLLVEIDRSALPPLGEGEYYHADLIGLPAFDSDGNAIGTVSGVENYGAGDLLEINLSNGRSSLISFKPGIAEEHDGRVVVDATFLA